MRIQVTFKANAPSDVELVISRGDLLEMLTDWDVNSRWGNGRYWLASTPDGQPADLWLTLRLDDFEAA